MLSPRDILTSIGTLPDSEIDIADAALQLASANMTDADWRAARAHLTELARAGADAAAEAAESTPRARAEILAGLITRRFGYEGDTTTYDDPANANLFRVIERRQGLPVALGILWLHTAQAAGWDAHGVDFPGHFLIGIAGKKSQTIVDVFAGGAELNARDLRLLIKRIEGPDAELRPALLRPMSTRAVLLRLQNNVKSRLLQTGAIAEALACAEAMLCIAPDAALLWREAALMNQRLDHVSAAIACYEHFLTLIPNGDAATRAQSAITELRSRLN